ncbi:CBS domain-containing protein [Fodinisporobacter ferrooxydans]|uniref:CBS domain-containing protein n=1 Tax=Fodinisporobacter ferrooxydans TaxID=2901836 RepID=A0ABY4CQB4_9BACL|nr:CBS domain-containing protein [Alicyclobacillaceae bacterium MYW30-H2]
MKLRELMTSQVTTVTENDTCVAAAKKMQQINAGSMPVVNGDRIVGMITDRDIVIQCIAKEMDPKSCPVSHCMSKQIVTGTPEMDAHEAANLMAEHQIRRLPVCDNQGKLVGIVAIGDLATVSIHVNEAGEALSDISESSYRTH